MKAKTVQKQSKSTAAVQQKTGQPFFQKQGEEAAAANDREAFFSSGQRTGSDPQSDTPFFQKTSSPFVQTKLTVGQPGDPYEQEADAMADKVVQRLAQPDADAQQPLAAHKISPLAQLKSNPTPTNHSSTSAHSHTPPAIIQPKCADCEKEEKKETEEGEVLPTLQRKPIFESNDDGALQMKCAACEQEEKTLQPKSASDAESGAPDMGQIESNLSSSKGGGSALPDDTRAQMEGAFGADFSGVRVHTGGSAVQMNRDLQAQAFTHGSDVYFNAGKYDTGSTEGKGLLAHELTHVVQQGGGGNVKSIQRQEADIPLYCEFGFVDDSIVQQLIDEAIRNNPNDISSAWGNLLNLRNQAEHCCDYNYAAAEHYLYARSIVSTGGNSYFEALIFVVLYANLKFALIPLPIVDGLIRTGVCPPTTYNPSVVNWGYQGAADGRDNLQRPVQRGIERPDIQQKLESDSNLGSRFQYELTHTPSHMPPAIQSKCADCEKEEMEQMEESEALPTVQRKPIFESNDDGAMQMKCAACEQEEKNLQPKSTFDGGSGGVNMGQIESTLSSSKGGGSALPDDTRTQMDGAFGADFSGVRIHTGSSAVQMNQDLQAQAFTHGSDVYFNAGKYDTGSTEGKRLLGHELTHTIQQGNTPENPSAENANSPTPQAPVKEEQTPNEPDKQPAQQPVEPASEAASPPANMGKSDAAAVDNQAKSSDAIQNAGNLQAANPQAQAVASQNAEKEKLETASEEKSPLEKQALEQGEANQHSPAPPVEQLEKEQPNALQPGETALGEAPPAEPPIAENEAALPSEAVPELPEAGKIATEIKTWKRKIGKSIAGIPQPALPTATTAAADLDAKGKEISEGKKAGRPDYVKDLQAKLPATPDVKNEPVVDLSPLEKEINALLAPVSNRLLPEHALPSLNPTPGGVMPRLGDSAQLVTAENEIKRLQGEIEKQKKEGATPEAMSDNQLKLLLLQKITAQALPENVPGGQPAPPVIKDQLPSPRKALPPAMVADVGSVIAQLLADPNGNAEKMIADVRKIAFPNEILNKLYPEIGNEEKEYLAQTLEAELRAIAADAGVGETELKNKVDAHNAKLAEEKKNAEAKLSEAFPAAQGIIELVCKDETAAIAGAHDASDKKAEQQMEAVKGKNDPEVIKQKATKLRQDAQTKVGQQRANYDGALQRRIAQLDSALSKYIQAYEATAMREEQKLGQNSTIPLSDAELGVWKDDQVRGVTKTFVEFKRADKKTAEANKKALNEAGVQVNESIKTWEESQTGEQKNWWEKLLDDITNWFTSAKAESEAWKQVNVQQSRDALVKDLDFLNRVKGKIEGEVDLEAVKADKQLTHEQKAIILSYYGKGPQAGNSIAAVAAGMQVRLKNQHAPQMIEKFYKLLEGKPASDWEIINQIARSEDPSFSADYRRNELRQAMKGWGTSEDRAYDALTGLTRIQRIAVDKCYEDSHGSLREDIEDDFSGDEQDRAIALMEGKTIEADAAALKYAMDGGFLFGAGTDEDVIMKTLRGKSEEERQELMELYKQKYDEDLTDAFEDEMSEHDLDMANALLMGDTSKADAIALDRAMNGGWTGAGTDEDAIYNTYQQIRKEVEAEAAKNKWTTAQMEAEILRRNQKVEVSFNKKYGGNYDLKSGESALRKEFRDELSGGELNLTDALADNDLIKADAARIAIERESFFYADDDKINEVLQNQYSRALSELRRDKQGGVDNILREREAAAAAADKKAGIEHKPWDRYKLAEEKRKLEAEWEIQAKERASQYMNKLEKTYDETRGFSGGLRLDLALNTSFTSQNKAFALLKGGGYLTPVQEIEFATGGAGTDEEALKKLFEGKTQEEIIKIEEEWNKKHPNEKLSGRIESELSGRDEFDTKMAMRGLPKDIKEDYTNMQDRFNWEISNTYGAKAMSYLIGGVGGGDFVYQNFLGGEEEAILRDRMAFLEKQYEIINNPNIQDAQKKELADLFFQQGSQNLDAAIKGYREQIDAATNGVATIAAITAAVVVGVILTVLTGGAAAPGVVAAIGSISSALGVSTTAVIAGASALAGLAASVATKKIMLGGAYGDEDFYYDMGVGAVDVAAAMATAGIGPAVLKRFGLDSIEQLAKNPKIANRIIAHFITEGVEGMVGSVPSALAGNVLNDQIWSSDNKILAILKGTAMEVGISGLASGGMGTIGAFGDPNVGKNVASGTAAHNIDTSSPHVVDTDAPTPHQHAHTGPGNMPKPDGSSPTFPNDVHSDGAPGHVSGPEAGLLPGDPAMNGILPDGVSHHIDPNLTGNTVEVHYIVGESGLIEKIFVTMAKDATLHDVRLHLGVVKTMQGYGGLKGRVKILLNRIQQWIGLNGVIPPYSKAWEAKLEVDKLPGLIHQKMQALQNPNLSSDARVALEADLRSLEIQLESHQKTIDELITDPGKGYVAAKSEDDYWKNWDNTTGTAKQELAVEEYGMPPIKDLPEFNGDPPLYDHNQYQYVKDKSKKPPFNIERIDGKGEAPTLRLEKDTDGNWKVVKSKQSGAAEEKIIVESWSKSIADAYAKLKQKFGDAFLVVPLKQIAVTETTFKDLIAKNSDFINKFRTILLQSGKTPIEIEDIITRLKNHQLLVIQGTGQLRRFDYRGSFGAISGDGIEVHHIIPLWLGGTHGKENLLGLSPEVHDKIHELFDSLDIDIDKNTALNPSQLQNSPNLPSTQGAAKINPQTGDIEFYHFDGNANFVPI